MPNAPTPSYGIAVEIECTGPNQPLAIIESTVSKTGAKIAQVSEACDKPNVLIVNIDCSDETHMKAVASALRGIAGITVVRITDRTLVMHVGGKIEVCSKSPLESRDELSMAYTPGVARVSLLTARDPDAAFALTVRRNTVAVVSDGSAVLGLGNIGPVGALPVMEGKAMLFKEFGGVDAFPICLHTQDPDEIVRTVVAIAPTFGGINLEDISAPRCFDIERRLKSELDIPVFHDDQHGTAAVVLAALFNAVKIVEKKIEDMAVVISGAGAAGDACARALLAVGVADVIVCDTKGALYPGRQEGMNPAKAELAEITNRRRLCGSLKEVLVGADLFLGISGPGLLTGEDIKMMAPKPVVFALSNPVPEIMPEEAGPYAAVIATGRSDYPNQINNVLCFPGLFRGLLGCFATTVTQEMIVAASRAIASVLSEEELDKGTIIPSVFNKEVAPAVATAVADVAKAQGLTKNVPAPETLVCL